MLEFPIEKIYRKVAKFDVIDKGTKIGSGSGFFYEYNDTVYFVTKRNNVIIKEKTFLPDSIILYLDTNQGCDKT
ncbi:MAG: hypothetical protein KGL95_02940, partial [Patescibacteria group bacterium]|nr:hypothetical protein [Patescibacteria group bacterium]